MKYNTFYVEVIRLGGKRYFTSFPDKMRGSTSVNLSYGKLSTRFIIMHSPHTQLQQVANFVQDKYGKFAAVQVSMAVLHGGELCAAIDRQHPGFMSNFKFHLPTYALTPAREYNPAQDAPFRK